MPNPDRRPLIWFSAEVDLREFSGQTLFTRGVTAVALPTFDLDEDEGVYENLHQFLHGQGSSAESATLADRRDLLSEMEAQDPLGITKIGIRVLDTDRLQIWRDTATFDLDASADNAKYGFPTAGASAVLDVSSGEYRLTATADWVRGPVEDEKLTISIAGPASYSVPQYPTHAQDVITLIRRRGRTLTEDGGDYTAGAYDADDMTGVLCLEALDNAANDTDDRQIRWYTDTAGHTVTAWPTSLSPGAFAWSTSAAGVYVMAMLGYSGDEETEVVGDVTILRGSYMPHPLVVPGRPWARRPRRVAGSFGESARLAAGGASAAPVGSYEDLVVEFWLDGPESPEVTDDLSAHYTRRFLPLVAPGEPLTMYVGQDLRRHLEADEVTSATPAYSTLYAADRCGGRMRMLRSVDDAGEVQVEFDEDMGGEFWASVSLRLMERAEGD